MQGFYPFCIIPHINKKYFISHSFDFASCLYNTTFSNNPNARWVYWVLLLSITPTHKKDVHFEKFKKNYVENGKSCKNQSNANAQRVHWVYLTNAQPLVISNA